MEEKKKVRRWISNDELVIKFFKNIHKDFRFYSSMKKKALRKKMEELISNFKSISFNTHNHKIYGGLFIDFNLMREDEDPMRISNHKQVLSSQFFENNGLMILTFGHEDNPNTNIDKVIEISQSINDCQIYHQIGILLQKYQEELMNIKTPFIYLANFISSKNLEEKYFQLYKQFEEYYITEIKKYDGTKLYFSFNTHFLSLTSFEYVSTLNGHSQALLKLRGVFHQDPSLVFKKNTYYFFTKDTCEKYILNRLDKYGDIQAPQNPKILTFDKLGIPFSSTLKSFSNRDHNYPYYNEQIKYGIQQNYVDHPDKKESNKIPPEFLLYIRFYEFEPADLERVQEIRKKQSKHDNLLYWNFEQEAQVCKYVYQLNPNNYNSMIALKQNNCTSRCCEGEGEGNIFQE